MTLLLKIINMTASAFKQDKCFQFSELHILIHHGKLEKRADCGISSFLRKKNVVYPLSGSNVPVRKSFTDHFV